MLLNQYLFLGRLENSKRDAFLSDRVNEIGVLTPKAMLVRTLVAVRVVQVTAVAFIRFRVQVVVRLTFNTLVWKAGRAIFTHWVYIRANSRITRACDISAEPSRHTLASFTVLAIPLATPVSAGWNITSSPFPAFFALTEIWFYWITVKT